MENRENCYLVLKPISDRRLTEFLVQHGQVTAVGRTAASDYVCGNDWMMSAVHFRLDNEDLPLILDTSSRNGTYLNGQKIVYAMIRNGDRIRAGNTRFLVQIFEHSLLDITPGFGVHPSDSLLSA